MTGTVAPPRTVGVTPRGDLVDCWALVRGDIRVEVLTHGARLHAVHVPDRDGVVRNVVVGPDDLAGHLEGRLPYAGAIVGRWANRLGDGRVRVGDTDHRLATNEGTTTLHGGPGGFDERPWSARDVSDDRGPAVRLHLRSPAGDNGFPGTLDVTATYQLRGQGDLALELVATTDAPTVVNLTTHPHWDLSGGGAVGDHVLRVPAGRVVVVDDRLLPVTVAPVDGTHLDLRRGARLGPLLDEVALDHCFLLDGDVAAELRHAPSGRRLVVTTDQPAVQVYVATEDPGLPGAVALEPQVPADAPNRPDLPLAWAGPLLPGEVYRHRTVLHFDVT